MKPNPEIYYFTGDQVREMGSRWLDLQNKRANMNIDKDFDHAVEGVPIDRNPPRTITITAAEFDEINKTLLKREDEAKILKARISRQRKELRRFSRVMDTHADQIGRATRKVESLQCEKVMLGIELEAVKAKLARKQWWRP